MSKRRPSEDPEISKTCLKRKVSSLFKKRPTRSILKKTKHEERTSQLSPSKSFLLVILSNLFFQLTLLPSGKVNVTCESQES